jgi:hypothetical protein
MDWRERSDLFNLGGMMQEFVEHIEHRLIELEAIVGLQPEQHVERENLRLAYLHIQEEMKHLRR